MASFILLDNIDMVVSFFLIIFLPIVALFWAYARYKLGYWKRRGLEQLPNIDLIFGNFKDAALFRTAPGFHLGKLHHMANTNSSVVGFYIFHKPCLLLRDPEIIQQILIRDFENFSDRHFAGSQQKDSIGMKNLFGIKNPVWKYLRRKIVPTLTREKLQQMFPLMNELGENMMNYLKHQQIDCDGTRIVDVQDLNYKYATDLIASIALGSENNSFNDLNGDFVKHVSEFFNGFKRMIALFTVFFIPEMVDKIGSRILFNSQFVKEIFWNTVNKREESGTKRGDFIDSLIELKNGKQNPVYKFEGENLLHQSGTFFSGFESSATTAAFTLMELARNKEYQQRAREDILVAIEKHGWTYAAINDMKYLDQCIAESIRLHPPVSTIDRLTRNEYKIPGTNITLESGTPIYISLYGLQKDARFFENSEKFDPERFRAGNKLSKAYIPFGLGPRMCIGMKVGQLHAKIVLSMILRHYEIHQNLEDMNQLDPRSTFTAAADGISLFFKEL